MYDPPNNRLILDQLRAMDAADELLLTAVIPALDARQGHGAPASSAAYTVSDRARKPFHPERIEKLLNDARLAAGQAGRAPRGRPAPETMYSTATTYSHTCMANNTAEDLQYSASIMITGRSPYNRYFVSQQQKP